MLYLKQNVAKFCINILSTNFWNHVIPECFFVETSLFIKLSLHVGLLLAMILNRIPMSKEHRHEKKT